MAVAIMGIMGNTLLVVIFLLCSFSAVYGLVAIRLGAEFGNRILIYARRAIYSAAVLAVLALILLMISFAADDFSIAEVARHSSMNLDFIYKLSASWSGSSGSALLWTTIILVLFAMWLIANPDGDIRFQAIVLSIGSFICLGFTSLLIFAANPFEAANITIDDGMGLNPLLQNFWNVFHPPLLFVGYSAFLIPFLLITGAVCTGSQVLINRDKLRKWLLFGICLLGLGIFSGAKWSYVELGWGGYWAWDPVENASLLPWLIAVAALHSCIGLRFSERFKLWIVALAPLPFILSLVATFITRSGILASVHAFGQNAAFSILLVFIFFCLCLWLMCFIFAAKRISIIDRRRLPLFSLDKTRILFWINIILIAAAVVIGIATFWPLVSKAFISSGLTIVPKREFYDRVVSVVGILLAFLIGLITFSEFQTRIELVLRTSLSILVGLVCFALARRLSPGRSEWLLFFVCGICGFSFAAVLIKDWHKLKVGRTLNQKRFSGSFGSDLAHVGVLLLIVSAGFSSYQQVSQLWLKKEKPVDLQGYNFVYKSFKTETDRAIEKVGPLIEIKKGKFIRKIWPHNNIYADDKRTSEVAVSTRLLEDIYVSFDSVNWQGEVGIEVHFMPFMLWLWVAMVLIIAGCGARFIGIVRGYKKS